MRGLLVPLVLVAMAAPALSRDRADPLAGRVAGKPQDCIDDLRSLGPDIVDDRTIVYRESDRRIWRNDLPNACPGLRRYVTLIVDKFGSQLCRNDRFRTIEPPSQIPGPVCRFGAFTPLDKPAR